MLDQILSIVSPHVCKGCGIVGQPLCQRCIFNIIKNKSCSAQKDFYSIGRRRSVLKQLTDDYKFKSERAIAKTFAEMLDQTLPKLAPDTVVVPVPTASAHVRQYGFDHTKLLAKKLARRRRLTYASLLVRTHNQTQHMLTQREREKAAETAFRLARSGPLPRRILLIDDVVTTGATLRAARKILRQAGVKNIKTSVICYQNKNGV
jgi:ComF family protein